jgi:hypothetical protein
MIGVLFFTFFKAVPQVLLSGYEWLVYLVGKYALLDGFAK